MNLRTLVASSLVLACLGCEPPPTLEEACTEDKPENIEIQASIGSVLPDKLNGDLRIVGRVTHKGNFAIHDVSALDTPANADQPQFRQFTLVIPIGTLDARHPSGQVGEIELTATDACNTKSTAKVRVDRAIDLTYRRPVKNLALALSSTVAAPTSGAAAAVTDDQTTTATLNVSADAPADGAEVVLTFAPADRVIVDGAPNNKVVLRSAQPNVPASASVSIRGRSKGFVLINAAAGSVNAPGTVLEVTDPDAVKTLKLELAYPTPANVLPDDESAAAILTVSANVEADGAEVTLAAEPADLVDFDGAPANKLILAKHDNAAVARVLVLGKKKGTALVNASSGEVKAAGITIEVADPDAPNDLSLSLAYATGQSAVLDDGSNAATLTVTANPEAEGAEVTLGIAPDNVVAIDGAPAGRVLLQRSPTSNKATASVLVRGRAKGTAVINATVGTMRAAGVLVQVLDSSIGRQVRTLSLQTRYPATASAIPVDGSRSAELVLSANASATGRVVRLTASPELDIPSLNSGQTTLGGDGVSPATTTLNVYAKSTAGLFAIEATADGVAAAPAFVKVVGPPRVFPKTAQLRPGQEILGSVESEVLVRRCVSSGATSLTAVSGTTDLSGAGGATDMDGDGRVDVRVSCLAGTTTAGTLTVACTDVFGQTGTASFTCAP